MNAFTKKPIMRAVCVLLALQLPLVAAKAGSPEDSPLVEKVRIANAPSSNGQTETVHHFSSTGGVAKSK